jgi:hypothetical protein
MCINGTSAFAEVEYFFRLRFGDIIHSLALVSFFSPPDQDILKLSNNAAYICFHGGIDSLVVVDIKAISAVVSMVPDYEVTVDGDVVIPDNRFSMLEAPFLKLATLSGNLGDDDDDIGDTGDTIE